MAPMSFGQKISKFISVFDTTTILLVLLSVVLISVMFLLSEGKTRKYSYMIYGIILVVIGAVFHDALFPLIDMFIERLFYLFYFPTGAIYMITLVTSHIIFIITLGNKKLEKTTKRINFLGFGLMQVLCINILRYLSISDIDLTNELNFVRNQTMIGILELSMIIFVVWMGVLAFTSVARYMTTRVLLAKEYEALEPEVKEEKEVVLPDFKPVFSHILDKAKDMKKQKEVAPMPEPVAAITVEPQPEPVIVEKTPVIPVIEPEVVEPEPKMNQALLDRLLAPQPGLNTTVEVEQPVKPEPVYVQPKWNEAVVQAMNIPTEPIYNDVEETFHNRIEETVEETIDIPNMDVKSEVEKQAPKNPAMDLCQMLLRKETDDHHSLEDYLELKKYLVAQK